VVRFGTRHRTGNQRPRQSGNGGFVRGGANSGAGTSGHHGQGILSVSTETTPVAQALAAFEQGRFDIRAKSPDFLDEWWPDAERLCRAFGTPPDGVRCPLALFAQPFGPRHVAIVQVTDEPSPPLAFRIL